MAAPASSVSAIFSGWLGAAWLQTEDSDYSHAVVFAGGGDARVKFDLWSAWDLQLELAGVAHGQPDTDGDPGAIHVIGGAHLIDRFEGGAWGGFLAGSYTQTADTGLDVGHVIGGVEYARLAGKMIYTAQLGAQTVISGDKGDSWSDGIFATASARYFVTDNSVFGAKLGIGGLGSFDGDDFSGDALWGQWGVDYEHRFGNSPVSLLVAYQGDLIKDLTTSDWEDNLITHTVKVGLRVSLGGSSGSIYEAASQGAGTFALPDLSTPLAYADDLW